MTISDLDHLEVVSEANSVEGGYASAYAFNYAFATGYYTAITFGTAFTDTISGSGILSGSSRGRYY